MDKTDLKSQIEEAKKAESSDNFFNAAIYYKSALEIADKIQDSQSIKLCKRKIVEMNKKSLASGKDFKEVAVTQELSAELQELHKQLLEGILKIKDKAAILKIIGSHPSFTPKVKDIEEQARNSMPLAYQFATLTTISSEGHDLSGGSIGSYAWFMEMYKLNQEVIMTMSIARLMNTLMNSNPFGEQITASDLSEYFTNSRLINSQKLKIILVGLNKYYEKDYISAMHILIPQFEALLLDIAQKCGINIVALDKKKKDIGTRIIILSVDHLDSGEFKTLFGADLCQQIKFVLFESLGYKLRHKIAHGEIQPSECNFKNTTLIVYLYLVLLAKFKVKEKPANTKD